MKKIISFLLLISVCLCSLAQRITPEQYIALYKDIAMSEMKRSGVPAAITLAQGILETECGNSELVKKSNNHFGIKCRNTWTGASVTHDDDLKGECFRAYNSPDESFKDHSDFLKTSPRYAPLFKLDQTDYRGWAYGLKRAGYATNPAYPAILIKNIEQYNLQQYSLLVLNENNPGQVSEKDSLVARPVISTDTSKAVAMVTTDILPDQTSAAAKKSLIHTVVAKEGLYSISKKYNVTVQQLKEWNNLQSDALRTGQQLFVQTN